MEAKMEYDEQVKAYSEKVNQVQYQLQQQSEAQQMARNRYVQEEVGKLVEVMPELADPKKAEAFTARINKAGEKFGYTKEQLASVTSHRDMMVLDAAAKYLELQSGKEIVRQKSKKARKPVKAGAKKISTKSEAVRKQRDKLRQSGSIEDAMSLILNPNLK
jgi:Na+/phosphate symporter